MQEHGGYQICGKKDDFQSIKGSVGPLLAATNFRTSASKPSTTMKRRQQ